MKYHIVTIGILLIALIAYLLGCLTESGILVGVGILFETIYCFGVITHAVKTIDKQ